MAQPKPITIEYIDPEDYTGYAPQPFAIIGSAPEGGAVESVNGQTGTVVLDASDVGALAEEGNAATATLAATATALATSRNIALTGDVTGTAAFDGTANASITAAIGAGVIVNADVSASAAIEASKIAFSGITGYNAAETQTLKNVAGTLTWVTDE